MNDRKQGRTAIEQYEQARDEADRLWIELECSWEVLDAASKDHADACAAYADAARVADAKFKEAFQ